MVDLLLVASLFWIAALHLQSWRLLLYFQQEEYDARRFLRWAGRRAGQLLPRRLLAVWLLVILASLILAALAPPSPLTLLAMGWVGGGLMAALTAVEIRRPAKIRLAYTLRVKRLLIMLAAVCTLVAWLAVQLAARILPAAPGWAFGLAVLLSGLLLLAAPVWVVLANLLLAPFEKILQLYYLAAAESKIRRLHPLVIGITGSYGKTSTKEFLAHLLAGHKRALATPKSYNTLLGVSRVINSALQPEHEVFIVEMGAYIPGEIARICKLVQPSFGTITAIGPQHLERFGSLENVACAKFELIKALPVDGVAVFNADDKFTPRFIAQADSRKTLAVSAQGDQRAELFAGDIQVSPQGLAFNLVDTHTGERAPCAVRLLGRHNIGNLLIASAIARELGMRLPEIAARLGSLAPVPHRLQLIERGNGVNVIDDAYNSNPVGARSALETLDSFTGGRKILITPGMVELGTLEWQENYELGCYAAPICDLVILVGPKRSAPIREGLLASSYPPDRVKVVEDLQAGIAILDRSVRPGDTILFLNDLPDLYSEKL